VVQGCQFPRDVVSYDRTGQVGRAYQLHGTTAVTP
jgi:hypothetical protein